MRKLYIYEIYDVRDDKKDYYFIAINKRKGEKEKKRVEKLLNENWCYTTCQKVNLKKAIDYCTNGLNDKGRELLYVII